MSEKNPAATKENIEISKQILKEQFPTIEWQYTDDIHVLLDTSKLEKFAKKHNLELNATNVALVDLLNEIWEWKLV
jgi:cell division protein FtsL